jgi:hypothetical protein
MTSRGAGSGSFRARPPSRARRPPRPARTATTSSASATPPAPTPSAALATAPRAAMPPRSQGQRTASPAQASQPGRPHRRPRPRTEADRNRGGPDLASPPVRVTRWPQTEACGTPAKRGSTISAEDKVKNTAETAKGKAQDRAPTRPAPGQPGPRSSVLRGRPRLGMTAWHAAAVRACAGQRFAGVRGSR